MQESNITNHSLIQILGKSQLSRQWRAFRKEVRELPKVLGHGPGLAISYQFANNGILVTFSEEGRVFDVTVWGPAALHYSEALGFVQLCQLQLPAELALEDKRAEIVNKLGQPAISTKRKPPMVEKQLPPKKAMRQQKETIEEAVFVIDDISIDCSFDSLQRGQLLSITFKTLGDRQRAEIYQTFGQYREAIAILENCMHKKPYDFLVLSKLAVCHGKLQEFAQAENYFQTAINSPLLEGVVVVPLHLNYANLLEKLGRFEDACEQLLIVYHEQERREDEQKEVTLQRLKKLETQHGITNKNLKKRILRCVTALIAVVIATVASGCSSTSTGPTKNTFVEVPDSDWSLWDEKDKRYNQWNSLSYERASAVKLTYNQFIFHPPLEREEMQKRIEDLKLDKLLQQVDQNANLTLLRDGRILASGGGVPLNFQPRPISDLVILDPRPKL